MSQDQTTKQGAVHRLPSIEIPPMKNGIPTVILRKSELWLCKNGHAVGISVAHKGLIRLLPFREAFTVPPEGDAVEIYAMNTLGFIDSCIDWPCSICGARRDWHPSGAFIQTLKKHKGGKR